MHRSIILSIAAGLTSLANASPAAVHRILSRADCGNLINVPLSPDPDHSTYTFILDQSLQDYINATDPSLNTIQLVQTCDAPDGGYQTGNNAYAKIDQFGPGSPYTITVDRCEKEHSRSPVGYRIGICSGDGTSCQSGLSSTDTGCGITEKRISNRSVCPVSDSGVIPKAISLNDPTAWSCKDNQD
ncbi:hypothetical protein LZ30DRAFT_668561 [Colletotrichum cereale]|nr:hypothetical protein LZ30DRAFT_668561 [Colletotrichum cereale]